MAKVKEAQQPDPSNGNKEENDKDLKEKSVNKNADPSNEAKMEANKKEGEIIVDPTQEGKPKIAHQSPRVFKTPSNPVIKAINGIQITLVGGSYKDGEEAIVNIARKAKVFLNGEEKTLAALDNGDSVVLGNGVKNERTNVFEYSRIDATRQVD